MISPCEDYRPDVTMSQRYKICPSCSHFVSVSARGIFCLVCGVKLIEECPQCSEPILSPLAKFCPVCGRQLANLERSRH